MTAARQANPGLRSLAWRVHARAWLAAASALILLASLLAVPSALAAPGVPAEPTSVYLENFENSGNEALLVNAYQGAAVAQNETYTAAAAWLRDCNGWVMTGSSPKPANTLHCDNYWSQLQALATSLGTLQGSANPAANHAVTAYTNNCGDPASPQFNKAEVCAGANQVQWETKNPITVPPNRYYTFSVDATYVNCFANHPLFEFSLIDGGVEVPVSSTPIDGCAKGDGAYHFASNGSIFLTSSTIGLRLRNAQGSTAGNDGAFDNIRLLDVTPTLDKSFGPTTQYAGRPSTLTFTITNTSELAAKEGWSFTDNLPAGLVVANPANASTTCPSGQVTAGSGGSSIAVKGSLKAAEVSCTVKVAVTSSRPGTFSNCPANVAVVGLNPPTCSSVTFATPDVAIEKTMTPSPLVPGKQGAYHLKVTNKGPGTAEGIVVSDPLPNGETFASASAGCSAGGGTVSCEVASLAQGASRTFDVSVKVAPSLKGCPANTASVTSATPDLNSANNMAQVCPATERQVDLSIEKTAASTAVSSGGQAIYTLVVKNDGPSDASQVAVVDPGAAGLSLVAAKPSQGSCSIATGHLSCDLGELVAEGSAQILVTANATAKSGAVSNTATVSAAEKEIDPTDNQASATIQVESPPPPTAEAQPPVPQRHEPQFDLVVVKSAASKRIAAGATAKYTIAVTNKGPDAAPNVKLTDTFNHDGVLVSASPSAGSCGAGLPLNCSLGDVAPGATVRIVVMLGLLEADCGERNAASAVGEGKDAHPTDNLSSVDLCVSPKLAVAKTANRKSVEAGGIVRYSIRVTNLSKKVLARDVRTCDNLPASLVFVASKPSATLSKGRRCWSLARLQPGKSVVYHLASKALRSAKGSERNVATAQGPGSKAVRGVAAVDVLAKQKPKPTPVTG